MAKNELGKPKMAILLFKAESGEFYVEAEKWQI
jgi:hypothetical protein